MVTEKSLSEVQAEVQRSFAAHTIKIEPHDSIYLMVGDGIRELLRRQQVEQRFIEVDPDLSEACLTAIEVWGKDEQLIQSMGECGEYTAAVGRYFQGRDADLDQVLDEAADVVILMMQIRELVGSSRFNQALARKFKKFGDKVSRAKIEQGAIADG